MDNQTLTIMFVDDDPTTNFLNQFVVNELKKSINSSLYEDSLEAINYLIILQRNNAKLPDLIILDLNMPQFDGFDFIRHLKEHEINIPVAVLTSSSNLKDIVKARDLDAFHYIEKPLSELHILDLMEKLGRKFNI
jgi:CheY-like chemotaxis protein